MHRVALPAARVHVRPLRANRYRPSRCSAPRAEWKCVCSGRKGGVCVGGAHSCGEVGTFWYTLMRPDWWAAAMWPAGNQATAATREVPWAPSWLKCRYAAPFRPPSTCFARDVASTAPRAGRPSAPAAPAHSNRPCCRPRFRYSRHYKAPAALQGVQACVKATPAGCSRGRHDSVIILVLNG